MPGAILWRSGGCWCPTHLLYHRVQQAEAEINGQRTKWMTSSCEKDDKSQEGGGPEIKEGGEGESGNP
jgi:hypothetical protein